MSRVFLVKSEQEVCGRPEQVARDKKVVERGPVRFGKEVNNAVDNFCHALVSPLSPFIHGVDSFRHQERLRLVNRQESHVITNLYEQREHLLTSHAHNNIRLQPSDLERLAPKLRGVVSRRSHLDSIPMSWMTDSVQYKPFPGADRSPLEGCLPPLFSASSTASQKSTSSLSSSSSSPDSSGSGSKFNPFAKCEPLTADVDTNRLYPRINRSASSNSQTSNADRQAPPLSPIHQSKLTTTCCSGSVPPSPYSSYDLFKSTQVVDYFADLMFDRRRRSFHFLSKTVTDLTPGTAAALALDAGIQNYARSLVDRRVPAGGNQRQQDRDATPTSPVVMTTKTATRVAPISRYRCTECPKTYSTIGGLSKHHQFCRRQTSTSSTATQHSESKKTAVATSKDQRCPQCDKSYTSSSALKMHIRTHTLPCRCRLCGKAFSRPWLLQGHLRTHTGEKPFECPHCSRAFADRSNLRAHLQTHYDVKQYNCTVCRRTFSRMSLLLKHRYGPCSSSGSANGNGVLTTGTATGNDNARRRMDR